MTSEEAQAQCLRIADLRGGPNTVLSGLDRQALSQVAEFIRLQTETLRGIGQCLAKLEALMEGDPSGLADELRKIPQLARGQVWCRTCGRSERVNGPGVTTGRVAGGWPKCCGYTMTIDSPEEQIALAAKADRK